jgi:predicted RNase H-like HicB family nuclease
MQVNKFFYPAIFHREGEGFWVTFPDFSECFTEGDDMELAYEMAVEALGVAITSRKAEHQENSPHLSLNQLVWAVLMIAGVVISIPQKKKYCFTGRSVEKFFSCICFVGML